MKNLNLIFDDYFIIYTVYAGFIPLGYFCSYDDALSCVDRFNIVVPYDYLIVKSFVKR